MSLGSKDQRSVCKFLLFEGPPSATEIHYTSINYIKEALSEGKGSKRRKGFKNEDWSIEDWVRDDQTLESELVQSRRLFTKAKGLKALSAKTGISHIMYYKVMTPITGNWVKVGRLWIDYKPVRSAGGLFHVSFAAV